MKKLVSVLLTFVLVLCSSTVAFASTDVNIKTSNIQEYNLSRQTKMNLNDVEVSEVLTFDEITEILAKDKNISKEEAAKIILKDNNQTNSFVQPQSLTYRTLAKDVIVTPFDYTIQLRFYCQTDESYTGWGILRILNVEMFRDYYGTSYNFVGNLYINLEGPLTIFYIINGDFYEYATTTYNSGVDIGLGEGVNVSFGASYTNNHYKYFYEEGRANFMP